MPRMKVAVVAAVCIGGLVIAGAALIRDEDDAVDDLEVSPGPATVACTGSKVTLRFDPGGAVEAKTAGITVVAADAEQRALSLESCDRAPTQRGWDARLRYTTRTTSASVTCALPGRFFVHVHPVSPSWAGGRPAGSAVYIVLGRRVGGGTGPDRTIVASAAVVERERESELAFAPRFCAAG